MKAAHTKIRIEGDYIDSFLYSGTLFLVHATSEITTHPWEDLLDESIEYCWGHSASQAAIAYLKDCRRTTHESISTTDIHITEDVLRKNTNSRLQLTGWPTDINIYSNKLYIANEDGVDELNFKHESREIDTSGRFTIYNKYSYKVSPNDGHRIAIAAGVNGVVAAYPRGGYIKSGEDLRPLIEAESHDCEWIGQNLAANTTEGAFLFRFPELPKRPTGETPPSYWDSYNIAKKANPSLRDLSDQDGETNPYAWIAGKKLYKFYESGELQVQTDLDNESTLQSIILKFPGSSSGGGNLLTFDKQRILAARTALFGTVAEIGDKLFSISDESITEVSHRPAGWRIFPRAKSYLNQLHIIEDEFLTIIAHHPHTRTEKSDIFEIGLDEVI